LIKTTFEFEINNDFSKNPFIFISLLVDRYWIVIPSGISGYGLH